MQLGLVSVVIPNFNYSHYVGAAIESVLSQTYRPIEVIVIDDGSSDQSVEVLFKYQESCTILVQRNSGQSVARNNGILASSGEFVAFLDADDLWRPDKVELQMRVMEQSNDTGLVYCHVTETDDALRPLRTVSARSHGHIASEFVEFPGRAIIVGGESSALIRRECIARVGLFEPGLSISAGWDLWRRIAGAYRIDFVPNELVLYRQHQKNMHLDIGRYERDVRLAAKRMFDDPAMQRFRKQRARHYAVLNGMFARSYARSGDYHRALSRSAKGMYWWCQSGLWAKHA